MSKRKTNPRRRPATEADVSRAKRQATDDAVRMAWSIFFMVLSDKEGYDLDGLRRVWGHVEILSDSIARGYCSVRDLREILWQEMGAAIK